MQDFTLVIFGITSNLAQIKLIPTLYDLNTSQRLSHNYSVIGVGRTQMDQEEFKSYIRKTLRAKNRHHTHAIDKITEDKLLSHLSYLSLDLTDQTSYIQLKNIIKSSPSSRNRMYYLATFPSLYESIFTHLKSVNLTGQKNGWTRILIEKPIGTDRDSATALNQLLAQYFEEDQIFRLDHYLGKETLHDILNFRFKQSAYESKIDKEFVDHIQIIATEDYGIGFRGSYYDQNGALKDVGQNHILQMIALATMNKPQEFNNEQVTLERVNILKNLVPEQDSLVIGQYEGYQSEPNVAELSDTETFFAFRTSLDNDRFTGVPIYVRGGKYLKETVTEIKIIFKNKDILTYRIGPRGAITLKTAAGKKIEYTNQHVNDIPDAYQKLIFDALHGDQTYFNDAEEIDAQWVFTDVLLQAKHKMKPSTYPRGSWGPKEANDLIEKDGRSWII